MKRSSSVGGCGGGLTEGGAPLGGLDFL